MSRDSRHDTEAEPNMRSPSPVSELVERLLKVADSELKYGFDGSEAALREAASTLTHLAAENALLREREGWKLVPVEPTREHLERLAHLWGYTLEETAGCYAAFLDALPASPSHQEQNNG